MYEHCFMRNERKCHVEMCKKENPIRLIEEWMRAGKQEKEEQNEQYKCRMEM